MVKEKKARGLQGVPAVQLLWSVEQYFHRKCVKLPFFSNGVKLDFVPEMFLSVDMKHINVHVLVDPGEY